ncbi:MAG: hypothetical protein DCF16_14020, partial [Alphaproteobacteria bacterium]
MQRLVHRRARRIVRAAYIIGLSRQRPSVSKHGAPMRLLLLRDRQSFVAPDCFAKPSARRRRMIGIQFECADGLAKQSGATKL